MPVNKKILFVAPALGVGGAERVVVHLVNYLDKSKYDVLLVFIENKRDYQPYVRADVKLECLDKESRWDFIKLIFKLRRTIVSYGPDVVISFLFYNNIISVIAKLISGKDFRLIISERNYPRKELVDTRLGWLKRLLVNLTYPKADRILTVTKRIGTVLTEDFRIPSGKIRTIYNPIPLEEIREKTREEVAIPFVRDKDTKIIVSSGRLENQKRFDRLLRAFSLIKDKTDKVHLIILGEGKLLRELQALAEQLNIHDFVHFVGFQLNPYAWIAKADIFVLSSDFEGFPNVLIEAMACGVPVISTDCPTGPAEIITNGLNGILVPLDDEKALAQSISDLLKDQGMRNKISAEAGKRVADFRIEKIIQQYEENF